MGTDKLEAAMAALVEGADIDAARSAFAKAATNLDEGYRVTVKRVTVNEEITVYLEDGRVRPLGDGFTTPQAH